MSEPEKKGPRTIRDEIAETLAVMLGVGLALCVFFAVLMAVFWCFLNGHPGYALLIILAHCGMSIGLLQYVHKKKLEGLPKE